MKNFIQNIKKKPKNVRDNYALAFSTMFTLAVASVWLMNFSAFDANKVSVEEDETKQQPFATLIKESKEQLASIKDAFTKISQGENTVEDAIDNVAVDPNNIILTEEDLKLIEEKKTNSTSTVIGEIATSTVEVTSSDEMTVNANTKPTYSEVMIGTTTATSSSGL
jgi:hypothetical protein